MSSQNDAHSELDDPGVDLGKALAPLHHWTMPKLTSPSERELALKRLPSGCLYLPRTWRRRCKLAPSLSLSPLHECDIHRSCLYRRHCHSFFFALSIVPRDSYSLSHSFPNTDSRFVPCDHLLWSRIPPPVIPYPKGPGSNQKSLDFKYRIHNGLVDLLNNLHAVEGGHISRDKEFDKAASTTCSLRSRSTHP